MSCESLRPIFIQNILDYIVKFYNTIEQDLYITRYNNHVDVGKNYDQNYFSILSSNYDYEHTKSNICLGNVVYPELPVEPIKPDKQQIELVQQRKYTELKLVKQRKYTELKLVKQRENDEEKKKLPLLYDELNSLKEKLKEELKIREEHRTSYLNSLGIVSSLPFPINIHETIYWPPPSHMSIESRIISIENQIQKIESFNIQNVENIYEDEKEYEQALVKYQNKLEKYPQELYNYKKGIIISDDCIKYRKLFLEHFGLDIKRDFIPIDNNGKRLQKTNMYGNIIY
ncbi:MAG: hypothetical protein HFI87_04950 [Bacilli bacterium]|nr:hypothetical protein [Bacilli bacterium]